MFRSPWWLAAGAAALAAAWGLARWAEARRSGVAAALGREGSLLRAANDAAPRRRRATILRLAALALIFLALAGPQWGVELVETGGSSRQVVIAMDVSLSMRTADVKPSRLERAKSSLSLLLDQLAGDRVGVVAFAGDAQVVCPLTSDVDAAKELLGALDVGAVPVPGTAIGTAIRTATAMIGRYSGDRTVVLLTDGEDHRSDPLGAARDAAAAGVRIFTVGIGTPEGEPIPVEAGGYKKDAKGGTVVSRLGEDALSRIAKETGGEYFRTSPGRDEVGEIAARIKAGRAAEGLSGTTARWRDRYAWPLAGAFLLLLLEMLLPVLPSRAAKSAVLLALLAAAAPPSRAASGESVLREGNRLYQDQKYEDALERYGEASGRRPNDPRPVFNAGDALFRLERDSDAAGAFSAVAAQPAVPGALRAAALYNLGNTRFHAGDYGAAADAYRKSLALAPGDADARRNLVIALKRKNAGPPKKNKKEEPKKNPQDQKKEQDQKNGGDQRQQDRSRPQDSMTREDAERVMRAVEDREKAARKQAAQAPAYGNKPPPRAHTEEDW